MEFLIAVSLAGGDWLTKATSCHTIVAHDLKSNHTSMSEVKPLPFAFSDLKGVSEKAMTIHHDKLYAGYVAKRNEIGEKLKEYATGQKSLEGVNPTYSDLRSLADAEIFATNGTYLHEFYFSVLGGTGEPSGPLVEAIKTKYGSYEKWAAFFAARGMASRGWVILAWDTYEKAIRCYNADAHNQGGIWGAVPIIVLDVYEHAYFMDYGSDRKAYIADFFKNLNWEVANQLYEKVKGWQY